MLTGKIEQFQSFSQFKSLKDFNNNIEQFMLDVKKDFTKKELVYLKRLIRFSSKVFGVSNISIKKLVQAVKDHDQVSVSEVTFQSTKRKAVKFGLLSVHETKRIDNSQSSNLWVFNAYSTHQSIEKDSPINIIETLESTPDQQSGKSEMIPLKTCNLSKTSNNNTYKERKAEPFIDHTFVFDNKFERFIDTIKNFHSNYYKIKEFIKAIKQNSHKYKKLRGYSFSDIATQTTIDADIESLAIETFKKSVDVIKSLQNKEKRIKNNIGLFVKMLKESIRTAYLRS